MKILIVEDDLIIRRELSKELASWGYSVWQVEDFNDVIEDFQRFSPDLVLMDVMLPGINGFFWCEEIRKHGEVPVIFISSKDQPVDIVTGMQIGGDDYITKPFDLRVVRAKIKAVLRRSDRGNTLLDDGSLTLQWGKLVPEEARLYRLDNDGNLEEWVDLTKTEMLILKELFEAQGKFVARQQLMESCWQGDDYIDDNTLAVNIVRLRKKMKQLGRDDYIVTKKGFGYGLLQNSK